MQGRTEALWRKKRQEVVTALRMVTTRRRSPTAQDGSETELRAEMSLLLSTALAQVNRHGTHN